MPFLIIGVVGAIGVYFISQALWRSSRVARSIVLSLGWLWVWIVIYLAFGTASGGGQKINLVPLNLTNPADLKDFLLNALMFSPLGILSRIWGLKWTHTVLQALAASFVIEAMQYFTMSGRTADINDLLANTVGCAVGFLLTALAITLARRNAPSSIVSDIETQ